MSGINIDQDAAKIIGFEPTRIRIHNTAIRECRKPGESLLIKKGSHIIIIWLYMCIS
jgi:hypothetical protein